MTEEIKLRRKTGPELEKLSRRLLLALNRAEMLRVRAHYREIGREPTDIELETIAQTWSEHCGHKTLKGTIAYRENGRRETIVNLVRETIFRVTAELDRPDCLSVFRDNAGIIALDEKWGLAFKAETHNHPSALEPGGGAETGVGGVIRDILGAGLGARPILNTDVFCFGPLDIAHEDLPPAVLHPRRIYKGVVGGVRDYGNRMGIPTVNGSVLFDPGYIANPLVFCGTLGLIPRNRIAKEVRDGDLILVAGGRTGRDGVHGATFSSLSLKPGISASVVQIGAPVTEKKLADVLLRARDLGYYRGISDCGAGGLSSAVGELGEKTGAEVHLDKVPLKYAGLRPWEIWVSEAQERMVLVVPPKNRRKILDLFAAEDVEATVIGRFTGAGRLRLFYRGRQVGELPMSFLHEGLPMQVRQAVYRDVPPRPACLPPRVDPARVLGRLLAHPNIASREKIVRQYDHEVQGQTALKPLSGEGGPSDAAVIKPLEVEGALAVVVSNGINLYGRLDPWLSAANAMDEALRNLCAVGGNPEKAALLDNFCWGDTGKPSQLGALVRAARACYWAARAYGTPFISGKDSLNNYFTTETGRHISIPPTLLISAVSVIEDVSRVVSPDLKEAGNQLYLLGATSDEIGGSHFLKVLRRTGGRVPAVDPGASRKTMVALYRAIAAGLVRACHDLSEGGLAVALAEMAFGGVCGAKIDLRRMDYRGEERDELALFSESSGRFLAEVAPGNRADFEAIFRGLSARAVGRVIPDYQLRATGLSGGVILDADCAALKKTWSEALPF